VRTELIAEAKNALRSELEMELGAAADEAAVETIRKTFSAKERAIETSIDSKVSETMHSNRHTTSNTTAPDKHTVSLACAGPQLQRHDRRRGARQSLWATFPQTHARFQPPHTTCAPFLCHSTTSSRVRYVKVEHCDLYNKVCPHRDVNTDHSPLPSCVQSKLADKVAK
jgi:hypothetical protein